MGSAATAEQKCPAGSTSFGSAPLSIELGLCNDFNWRLLPKCLLLGLPIAMSKNLNAAFWETEGQAEMGNDYKHRTKCGCPQGRDNKNIAWSDQYEINTILNIQLPR